MPGTVLNVRSPVVPAEIIKSCILVKEDFLGEDKWI